MGAGTLSVASGESRSGSIRWPLAFIETVLVVAAIVLVFPLFAPFGANDNGRGDRFAAPAVAIDGLPALVLPGLCKAYGTAAEDIVRDRLCGLTRASAPVRLDAVPSGLASARLAAQQAFLAPLRTAEARIAQMREQQREGVGDVHVLGDAIEAARDDIAPFLERYAIAAGTSEGPRPLACAYDVVRSAFANGSTRPGPARDAVRANVVLLLGAALDGEASTGAAASSSFLPPVPASRSCQGLGAADAFAATAGLMADARDAPIANAKNDAMRRLLHSARWEWAAWGFAGLLLLQLSRLRGFALPGVALALFTWAAAAWIGRVPWPFAGKHAFVLGRDPASWHAMPALFVWWMIGAGLLLLAIAPFVRRETAGRPQMIGSPLAYPGLVLATGLGWLVLLDLSANGHFGNRYLAAYHHGHLWLGMATFSIFAFVRQPLGRVAAWMLSLVDGVAGRLRARLGSVAAAVLLVCGGLVLTLAIALLLLNVRQLTSELGRLWLVIGAAWFFFMRGTPLTERLARTGTSLGSLVRYVWPLVFVVLILVVAMVITRDMGPLLIAGYAAGAFVAASVAMWWHQRSRAVVSAYGLAVVLFSAWIAATTFALFRLGALDDVASGRLENQAAPLASANDHLALVTWFQRATPSAGFGPGNVPWCGYGAISRCAGVPAQIQSDYTFTALVGMFGWTVAWIATLGCAVWLFHVVRAHVRSTRGEPRLVRAGSRIANDEQAFLSWLCVSWVVLALCQLAVTVAGNLAVIPLTGVTFPFVSFGMVSLVTNMAMLGLAVNVNVPEERRT